MDENKPKVSVIVPVYNVEKYIRRCLDAIIAQSYENWEAILVDDGSTDSSGEICDEYARNDKRFVVVHQENGGVAKARNIGLKMSSGDYLAFCDADDYYQPRMIELLVKAILYEKKDIAMCGYLFIDENNEKIETNNTMKLDCGTYSSDMLMEFMFRNKIQNYLWNKLFDKKLFRDICFEEGMTFEDALISPYIYSRANGITIIDYEGYAYFRFREGNISSSSKVINELAFFKCMQIRYELANSLYSQYICKTAENVINSYVSLRMKWKRKDTTPNEKILWDECRKKIYAVYFNKIVWFKLSCKIKIRGGMAVLMPWVLYALGKRQKLIDDRVEKRRLIQCMFQ